MSCLVSCLLTLRLHLNDCDFDSRPLFLVSLFLSLYTHINVYVLLLLLSTIFPGTDKTGTGLSSVKVGLGISGTYADSQWNPVYNVFHRNFACGNETIRR